MTMVSKEIKERLSKCTHGDRNWCNLHVSGLLPAFYKCDFQSGLGPLKSCYFSVRKPTFQLFTSQHTCHKILFYTVSEKIPKKHCNILGQTWNWLNKTSGTNLLQWFLPTPGASERKYFDFTGNNSSQTTTSDTQVWVMVLPWWKA